MSRGRVEDALALDVRVIARAGALVPGAAGSLTWTAWTGDQWRASYTVERDALRITVGSVQAFVRVEWTPGRLGGRRPWLRCPVCHRRCVVVYLSGAFACRVCCGLAYRSQALDKASRLQERAEKLRRRLAGGGAKPWGMHWSTYRRLLEQIADLEEASLAVIWTGGKA